MKTRQANCCYNCKHSEPSNHYIYDGSSICIIDNDCVMDYEVCDEWENEKINTSQKNPLDDLNPRYFQWLIIHGYNDDLKTREAFEVKSGEKAIIKEKK